MHSRSLLLSGVPIYLLQQLFFGVPRVRPDMFANVYPCLFEYTYYYNNSANLVKTIAAAGIA